MSTRHLLHPDIAHITDVIPPFDVSADNLVALRESRLGRARPLADADAAGVRRETVEFDSADGTRISGVMYVPHRGGSRPGYLHMHGGGYVMGEAIASDDVNLDIAARLGVVVLSVDYRLAPEHPVPAPLEDCYAGLAWLMDHARDLSIERSRIGIGGESAGGGLAAALALLARERGEYDICHQHLTYPMLDDRTGSDEAPGDPLTGEFVWTRASNRFAWAAYLGDAERSAPQVPARAASLAGLPNTWMFTGMLDLFRDENIAYARRLMAEGVQTGLIVYPGACHGFQLIPASGLTRRFRDDHLAGLARGLAVAS